MHKVLIISRSFPPENRAASYRPYSWAKYFQQFGVLPTFVVYDYGRTEGEVIHKEFDTYEVYYVPFQLLPFEKWQKSKCAVCKGYSKLLYLFSYLFQYSIWHQPEGQLYRAAKEILKNGTQKYDSLIVTVPPFILLKIGAKLGKKFSIPWIADYRDEWNSSGSIFRRSGVRSTTLKIIDFFKQDEEKLEKKWTLNTSYITTVSEGGCQNIQALLPALKVKLVPNGFFVEDFEDLDPIPQPKFTFAYAGTLHQSQDVALFLDACVKALNDDKCEEFNLLFVGFDTKQRHVDRIKSHLGKYAHILKTTPRVSKEESIRFQAGAHCLVLFKHKNIFDIPSSKLYEYVGLRKPVVLFPSDCGVMESTLLETGQLVKGLETVEDMTRFIIECSNDPEILTIDVDKEAVMKYSRKESAKIICRIIKTQT